MEDTRTLPNDCQLLEQLNNLRDMILKLNLELKEKFGNEAVLDVQRINPGSQEYKDAGFRWFVVLPWPQLSGKEHRDLVKYVTDKIISFDSILNVESFGCTTMVAGGAMALMIGLRENPAKT